MAPTPAAILLAAGLAICPNAAKNAEQGACATPDAVAPDTVTRETLANSFTKFGQTHPSIASLDDGSFVVVWASKRQEAMSWGIFAQRFDAAGRPVGTETHINETVPGTQWRPSVASNGEHVWITWQTVGHEDGVEAELGEVYARRFSRTLEAKTGEIRVNSTTAGEQGEQVVEVFEDGRAFIAWTSETGDGARGVARVFDAEGEALTDETPIDRHASDHSNIVIRRQADTIVAAWTRTENNERSIVLSTFNDAIEPVLEPVVVSESPQSIEASIALTGGGVAVGWLEMEGNAYRAVARRVALGDEAELEDIIEIASPDQGEWLSGLHLASSGDEINAAFNIARKDRIELPAAEGPVYVRQRARAFSDVFAVTLTGDEVGDRRRINVSTGGTHTLPADRGATALVATDRGQFAAVWTGNVEGEHEDSSGVALTLSAPASLETDAYEAPERVAAVQDPDLRGDNTLATTAPPVVNTEALEEGDIVLRGTQGENGDPGFTAWTATNLTPPDPDIAVGPNHILGCVNPEMRVFDKSGNQLLSSSLIDFFSDPATSDFLFDPVALFDPHSQKFILACNELRMREGIHVGISQTDSALSPFNTQYYDSTAVGLFPDFPNLGVDKDAIYVASDLFSAGGNFIFVFDKQDLIDGTPTDPVAINTIGFPISLGAVKTFDADAPAQYFITSADGEGDNIFLYAVTGGPDAPVGSGFVSVPTPQFDTADDAPQQGSSNRVSTVDRRIKNGVYRNGILYCAHGVSQTGPFGLPKVRWYAIDPQGWPTSGNSPILVDTGVIDPSPSTATWFPDISVDANGSIAMVYARSSLIEPVKMGRAFKLSDDAPGTVQGVETWITSTSPEEGDRWGDYFGIDDDPSVPGRFWGHGEYRTSNWRTWIGSFDVPQPPVGDCPADVNADGTASPADFTAWLGCFNDPMSQTFCDRADINGVDGITPADFTAWLAAFQVGCP